MVSSKDSKRGDEKERERERKKVRERERYASEMHVKPLCPWS